MKSKTIILSNENESGRGILTLYEENGLLECRIRLYNLNKLNRYCKLGIFHNNQVYSANLLEKNGVYLSSMVGEFNIDNHFYSAIIDTQNNNKVLISGGTYAGFFLNEESVFNNVEKENPNTNIFDYGSESSLNSSQDNNHCTQNDNSESCDEEIEENKCLNCKYRKFFYSQTENSMQTQNLFESVENITISSEIDQGNDMHTVNAKELESEVNKENNKPKTALIQQFGYVFQNYPKDELLNSLIPNGKFVKIEENNNSYSIGAIYQEEQMKYICYATFSDYNAPVPQELGEHYQWLPVDKMDPLSDGYYIVFQDAEDLKIISQ